MTSDPPKVSGEGRWHVPCVVGELKAQKLSWREGHSLHMSRVVRFRLVVNYLRGVHVGGVERSLLPVRLASLADDA